MQETFTKETYSEGIISFNKNVINDDDRKKKVFSDERAGKMISAAFVHDGEFPIDREWTINKEKLEKVLGKNKNMSEELQPFRWNTLPDNISDAAFGVNSIDKYSEEASKKANNDFDDALFGSWATYEEDTFRMARAFPTFKIYFIEDDTGLYDQRPTVRNFDDFYSYSAVKDIRIVRSRKIAADLCVITIANMNGELDFLSYSNDSDEEKSSRIVEKFDPSKVNTDQENPFSKLVVVEGSKIQVRLGYSNNPSKLETVFNGQVVEVDVFNEENNYLAQLVCQSYGVELVQELKGVSFEKEVYETTQELLSTMICSPEVTHFGRWSRTANYSPEEIRQEINRQGGGHGILDSLIKELKNSLLRKWTFLNKPQDDNIFAPKYGSEYGDISDQIHLCLDWLGLSSVMDTAKAVWDALGSNGVYHPYRVTIWDIFKEMELRHPGFVAFPVPYEQRYTMFFGPPSHSYWSRSLKLNEKATSEVIDNLATRYASAESRRTLSYRSYLSSLSFGYANEDVIDKEIKRRYKEQLEWMYLGKMDRFRPFRKYWTITSDNHIVANHIRASASGVFNAIDLTYFEDPSGDSLQKAKKQDEIISTIEDKKEVLRLKLDDNIEDKDTRIMKATYYSCYGDYYARRYASGLLMRSLRDMYKGEVLITGNPKIKPYDICYLYDSYNDMFGPIEVERVTHIFSQDVGFITEIKPDLVVTYNDWTSLSTTDAMWHVANQLFKTSGAISGAAVATAALATATLGLAAGAVGLAATFAGGYKIIQWTQERQPIVMTPLVHKHKPLLAGVDGYKIDNLIINIGGKWKKFTKDVKEGWNELWDNELITNYIKETATDFLNY